MTEIQVGEIESGVPIPRVNSKRLTAAQEQVLKLPVGGSFVLTCFLEENDDSPSRIFTEAAYLQSWANSKGLKLRCRQQSQSHRSVSHRIWRVG